MNRVAGLPVAHGICVRLLAMVLGCLLSTLAVATEQLTLGVFAYRPKPVMVAHYQPLADYLSQSLPDTHVELQVLNSEEMEAALRRRSLDLIFTNPSHFMVLRQQAGLTGAIATVVNVESGQPVSSLAGVIVSLQSRKEIQGLADIRGKVVAVPVARGLGGYQAQALELLKAGIQLPEDVHALLPVQGQDDVIRAVLEGRADAGFVRSGLLESLVREGSRDVARLKVINPLSWPGFPLQASTRLYPEWAFAALPHVSEKTVRRIAAALYAIEPGSEVAKAVGIYGFTVPADYLPVESLARTLRLPPFEGTPEFTAGDIWARYRESVLFVALAAALVLLLVFRLLNSNRRLKLERARAAESEEVFRRLYEDILDPVLILKDGRIDACNQAALDLMRVGKDELQGMAPETISPEFQPGGRSSREMAAELLATVAGDQPARFDWTHRRPDGSEFVVEVSLTPIVVHGERFVYCGWTNITERQRAEDALRHSEARHRAVLQALGEGVYGVDREGVCTFINPAALAMLGWREDEVLGRNPHDLFHHHRENGAPYAQAECPIYLTARDGVSRRLEEWFFHKDGNPFPVDLTASALYEDGVQAGTVVVFRDIGEQKRLESELKALAVTDMLTDLPNRRYFLSRLDEELNRLGRCGDLKVALLMLDLDHFKRINDSHGHSVGDVVLRTFADVLRDTLRKTDLAGRLGGEEFAVLLPGSDSESARTFAERLRERVAAMEVDSGGRSVRFTVSIGVTTLIMGDTVTDAMARADDALYRAKDAGRNRVEMFVASQQRMQVVR